MSLYLYIAIIATILVVFIAIVTLTILDKIDNLKDEIFQVLDKRKGEDSE